QVPAAGVAQKLRVSYVQRDGLRIAGGIERRVATRQRDEDEMLPGQQVFELRGTFAPHIERLLSELNPAITQRGDVVDRLPVIAVPGDGRVAETDAGGGARSPRDDARGRGQGGEKVAALHFLVSPCASNQL